MLSLSKNLKSHFLHICPAIAHLLCFWRRLYYLAFCLFLIKLSNNLIYVLKSWIFHTWHYLDHPFHHLSNLATCFTRVHVICDFFHITCLSKTVLRHPTLGASKNEKFRLSRNSTKFDVVVRFRKTILTLKSGSSSEI